MAEEQKTLVEEVKVPTAVKEAPKEEKMIVDTCSQKYKEEMELLFRDSVRVAPSETSRFTPMTQRNLTPTKQTMLNSRPH